MTFAQWFLLLGDAQDDADGASLGMVQREVLGTAKEDADGGAVGEELREAMGALEGQTEGPPLRQLEGELEGVPDGEVLGDVNGVAEGLTLGSAVVAKTHITGHSPQLSQLLQTPFAGHGTFVQLNESTSPSRR